MFSKNRLNIVPVFENLSFSQGFPEEISMSRNASDGVMEENKTYTFTCEIPQIAPVKKLTVKWYKGDTVIHNDTFHNPKKEPVNLSAVFNFTATRQDNGVLFRCEAHLDLGPEGPHLNASSKEYNVTVHCKYITDNDC